MDSINLQDFYDLRVLFIAVLWSSLMILVIAALRQCRRSHSQAPLIFHFASHVAIAAQTFLIIFAASSADSEADATEPDARRMSQAFLWVQRASVLVWLVASRWMFYLVPRVVTAFTIAFPVASEWTRISLQLVSENDIQVVDVCVGAAIVVSELLSLCSIVGWRWLFLSDVDVLFRQIPEVAASNDLADGGAAGSDDNNEHQSAVVASSQGSPPLAPRVAAAPQQTRVADTLPLELGMTVDAAVDDFRPCWCFGSIGWSMYARWKATLAMLAAVRLLFDVLAVAPAYLLRVLVDHLSSPDPAAEHQDIRTSVVVIALLILCSLGSSLLRVHYNLKIQKIQLYHRGLLSDCIERHILRTRASRISSPHGDILNHMTVDAQRIADCLGGLYDAWALPLQVAFTLYLLYVQVSFAFVAGVVVTVALIPVNMALAKKIASVNTNMLRYNDERVLRINEVMNNIVYVKMCGWVPHMLEWIRAPRESYLGCLRWIKMLDAVCVFFWATTPVFVSLATFALFIAVGGELTPGRAVAALSLFNALILPLNAYPWVLNGTVEALVSYRRLQRFLGPFVRLEEKFEAVLAQRRIPRPLWPAPSDADGASHDDEDADSGSCGSSDDGLGTTNERRTESKMPLLKGGTTVKQTRRRIGGRFTLGNQGKRRRAFGADDSPPSRSRNDSSSIPSIFHSGQKAATTASDAASPGAAADDDRPTEMSRVLVDLEHCHFRHDHQPLEHRPDEGPDGSCALNTSPVVGGARDAHAEVLIDHRDDVGVPRRWSESPAPQSDPAALAAFSLYVASFSAERGRLVAVTGPAGGGKSTLLLGIAGEVRRYGGTQRVVRSSVALVEQRPFLQSGTIRSNILCGLPYRREWFDEVVRRCALDVDFRQSMEHRENTVIGDRGAGLSGGQRFRVALARAVYAERQLNLIDDGLGSLDQDVAAHIVDRVYAYWVSVGRCVVVVTHSADLIHRSDVTYDVRGGSARLLSHVERESWLAQRARVEAQRQEVDEEVKGHEGVIAAASFAPANSASPVLLRSTSRNVVTLDDISAAAASAGRATALMGPNPTGPATADLDNPASIGVDAAAAPVTISLAPSVASTSGMTKEITGHGNVSWSAVLHYLRQVGWALVVTVVFFIAAMQAARNLGDVWIALWVADSNRSGAALIETLGILAAVNACLAMVRGVTFAVAGLVAARNMHDVLLSRVLNASYQFFVTTSAGRIINRLSRDVYNVDDGLPFIINILLAQGFLLLGSVVVIVVNSSWVVSLLLAPVAAANYWIQKPYRRVMREIKRLESASRTPILDDLRHMVDGSKVLRAFGPATMTYFLKKARNNVSVFLRTNVNLVLLQSWFALRLQFAGTVVLAIVGLVTVYYSTSSHAASLGLALAYVAPLTSYVSGLLSAFSDTEKQMISVERIIDFLAVESEAAALAAPPGPMVTSQQQAPQPSKLLVRGAVWPLFGTIQFNDVSLRYHPDGPLVLRNITLHIQDGEKVAIVGRTGAGKTSLLIALLRLVRLQKGSITIDSEDIRRINPDDLRQSLSVFPQEPFLLHGSLRKNVDPFDRNTDDEVLRALDEVQLRHLPLSFQVEEGGRNLSAGQRHLIALARVILQPSSILLLDEPTATIDSESQVVLWNLLERHFKDSTVITITHRLDCMERFDRVVVLENGAVQAVGTWDELRKAGIVGALRD